MGIKFNCPNGHRMNVKTFLAGKKGKCPKCGVAVDVPMQSTADDVAETIVATADDEGLPEFEGSGDEVDDNVAAMAQAAAKAAARSASRMPSAIADDPMAYWYTCNQSGDRYGPVTGEALNRWLDEGRVAPESLVWREGWPQWRKADGVFPSLKAKSPLAGLFGAEPAAPAATEAASQPKMDDMLSDAIAGAASYETAYVSSSRRSSYKDKLMLTSMVLIGAVTVLAVVLLLVILN